MNDTTNTDTTNTDTMNPDTMNPDTSAAADDAHRHGVRLWQDWTDLWNGELAIGPRMLTDDFRVLFGSQTAADSGADDLVGGQATADWIGAFRARYRELRYRTEVGPIVGGDGTAGYVTCRWIADAVDADGTERQVAGHDILRVRGDRVDRAWSVTGLRNLLDR